MVIISAEMAADNANESIIQTKTRQTLILYCARAAGDATTYPSKIVVIKKFVEKIKL